MVQRMKEVRKTLGLNQTEFAKHLGITQTAYSMIESGSRPLALKYVKVICSAFNVNENGYVMGRAKCSYLLPIKRSLW